MICVLSQRVVQGDIDEKIKQWNVWFRTPLGLSRSLPEATELMKSNNMDPVVAIVPIAVAITDSTYEEWHR